MQWKYSDLAKLAPTDKDRALIILLKTDHARNEALSSFMTTFPLGASIERVASLTAFAETNLAISGLAERILVDLVAGRPLPWEPANDR